jgi:hypothetical protein
MKVLNLDKISAANQRKLVLGGVELVVQEMTVANFIETTRAAESLPADASLATQVEATVEMVLRSVPTATREMLSSLSLEVLQTIVAFIRGDDVAGVESDAVEGTPAGN